MADQSSSSEHEKPETKLSDEDRHSSILRVIFFHHEMFHHSRESVWDAEYQMLDALSVT
jgi:hypothetical protein